MIYQDSIADMNPCPHGFYGDLSGLSSGLARSGLIRTKEGLILRTKTFLRIHMSIFPK